MINSKNTKYLLILFLLGFMWACVKDPDPVPVEKLKITEVSIPSEIDVVINGVITISGKGFELNDQIILTLAGDPNTTFTATITAVTDTSAEFLLPQGTASGTYKITVRRGDQSLLLGTITINVITGTGIPDIEGMTVKGIVYCNGEGVAGVVVSDGYEVTVTDNNGIYYLPSQKKNGYVFISIPGDYKVAETDNIPQFFKRLSSSATVVEQKDFSLLPADNTRHVILTLADWHLANRNDDLAQYTNGFLPDVNATISEYSGAGTPVYGLTLGDMTWDLYWYSNNFFLSDYLTEMKKVNCPMFNTMGNHDNDPYVANDFSAADDFRNIIGPTYYSFNLGEVHYVVLDDIEYLNTGGSTGVVGDRNYNDVILSSELSWLQKDLAQVTDKSTPLIISIHSPLYNNPTLDGSGNQQSTLNLTNGSQFLSAVSAFSEVHIVSGHTHINFSVESGSSLIEHNTAAVCATWWWTGKTGYAGNHICKDGSPGGYGVWEVDGRDVKWYYKSIGSDKNYQFRSYDLNSLQITAEKFAPNSTDEALAPYAGDYASPNLNNEVLINIWGYDPQWQVSVRENGAELPVTRVTALDPLHIISYEAERLNVGAVPTSSFVTCTTSHLFKVTASGPATTLNISVTDRFGRVYTETMTRPKEFTYLME